MVVVVVVVIRISKTENLKYVASIVKVLRIIPVFHVSVIGTMMKSLCLLDLQANILQNGHRRVKILNLGHDVNVWV